MCPRDEDRPDTTPPRPRQARDPQAVGDLLGGVLATIDLDQAAASAAVGDNWEAIVGREVAEHCRPVGMKAGVLHARVDSSVWCQQLQLRSPEILAALRKFLGAGAPADLRFRVGYNQPPRPNRSEQDE